eukprot:scaffold1944_cov241-Pinguiococcus_pyrenoidosus.AAC.9
MKGHEILALSHFCTLTTEAETIFPLPLGIGGLSTAALLAKAGYKVAVLEQHDVAGGSSHAFVEGGFEFDVGIHYVGGQLHDVSSPLRKVFSVLTDGKLEWCRMDKVYDKVVNDTTGEEFDMSDDHRANNERILEKYRDTPGAEEALKKYKAACERAQLGVLMMFLVKVLPIWLLHLAWPLIMRVSGPDFMRTTKEVLEDECGITGDGKLRTLGGLLTYLFGDYGVPPERSPFFIQACLDDHYDGGAFFPKGGSKMVAKTMVACIQRRGGHVYVRAPVSQVLVEKDAAGKFLAKGVVCKGQTIPARRGVVSNAGFRNTFGYPGATGEAKLDGSKSSPWSVPLVPEEAALPQRKLLHGSSLDEKVGPSVAMLYLFVGLDGSAEDLGVKAQNIWRVQDWNHDENFRRFMALDSSDDVEQIPVVFIAGASAKDDDFERRFPGKSTVTIIAPVNPAWFQREDWQDTRVKHRGADYMAVKEKWKFMLLETMYKYLPGTRGKVAYADLGTPLTNNFYLGTQNGEAYGLDFNTHRCGKHNTKQNMVRALVPQPDASLRHEDYHRQSVSHWPVSRSPKLQAAGGLQCRTKSKSKSRRCRSFRRDSVMVGVATAAISGITTSAAASSMALLRTIVEMIVT